MDSYGCKERSGEMLITRPPCESGRQSNGWQQVSKTPGTFLHTNRGHTSPNCTKIIQGSRIERILPPIIILKAIDQSD